MGYRPEEFDTAFNEVSKTYPFARRSVAEQVLGHLERLTRENYRASRANKKPYWQLIREALNESNVMGQVERKPYKSIIGHIYGRHGNYVATRYREDPKLRPPKPRFPTEASGPAVTQKPNGQLMWQF